MKKILVLENVRHLDENLQVYLNKYHKDDTITIMYSVLHKDKSEIIANLQSHDTLCLSSSFYDIDQFQNFVELIYNFKNIKEINILYLHTNKDYSFVQFLNSYRTDKLVDIINTREVNEIQCTTYEQKSGAYLSKLDYIYDVISIFYNKKHDVIWLERQPIIDFPFNFIKYDARIYALENHLTHLKSQINKTIEIDKKDVSELKELLTEMIATIEYRQETEKEKQYYKQNEKWLKIMSKIQKSI